MTYTKAIDINPREPVYYENLATVVYLYRTDARAYYHLTNDQPVFDMALDLYRKAMALDPTNFALATELAESYYGIKPTRTDDALNAWTTPSNSPRPTSNARAFTSISPLQARRRALRRSS